MIADPSRNGARFAALVTVACGILTVPRLLTHELWRDEAWLWLVCRESASFAELHQALSRSGQGYLFPWLVAIAARFTESPLGLQLVNLAATLLGAWVFARWAPFSQPLRVLFLAGYFPFFEYAVLSRHYALGAALAWIACAAGQRQGGRVACALALALLCQTTVYGVILALAIATGVLLRGISGWRGSALASGLFAGGIFGLGLTAGILQLQPRLGTSFATQWLFEWQAPALRRVLEIPWRATVPVPRFELHFWNSNLLDAWPAVIPVLGVVAALLALWLVAPRRDALAVFAVGGCGLLAFAYVKLVGQARHHGHWWLLLVAALWFAAVDEKPGGDPALRPFTDRSLRRGVLLFLALLHAGSAAAASWMDFRHPFSNGPRAARHLVDNGLAELPLFGYREPPAASVALAVGRPLYAPSRGIFTTHPDWGPEQRDLPIEVVRCRARALARVAGSDVVLVFNQPIPSWPEVEPVIGTTGALVAAEDYWIARLMSGRLGTTRADAGCPDEHADATHG